MDFFVLDYSHPAQSRFAEFKLVGKPLRVEPPVCEDCGEPLGPLIRLPPYHYQVKSGPLGDLITDGMVFAVSERFRDSYRDSSLRGLSFSDEPVRLNATVSCFMASPIRTRTLLDEPKSGLVANAVRGCDRCRVLALRKLDRLILQESTWTGDDVFMMGCISTTLVTETFVEFVRTKDFTNFHFINQLEYHVDYSGDSY